MKKLFPTFVSAIVLTAALACSAVAEPVTRSLSVAPRTNYEPAAARGDAKSQTALGLKYSEIRDQQADAIAYKWFLRAANQGNAEAQLLLSGMAASGRGTEKNNVEAYKWAMLAGQNSTESDIASSASTILGVLNRQMTTEEINTARRFAGEFKPKAELVHTAAMQLSSKDSKPVAAPSRTDVTARTDAPLAKVNPVQSPKVEAPVAVAPVKVQAPAKPQTPVVAKVEPAPVVTAPVPQARTEPRTEVKTEARIETKTEPVVVARVEAPKVEAPALVRTPTVVPAPAVAPAAAEQPAAAAPAQTTTPAAAPAQTAAPAKAAQKSAGKSRHAGKQGSRHHRGNYNKWVGVASSYARAYGAYGW